MRPSRRRLTEQGADLAARNERLIAERDAALEEASAYKASAETSSRLYLEADEKYVDTHLVNVRLTEDLTAAREKLAEYGGRRTVAEVLEEHDVHRKALADALGDGKRDLGWDALIGEVGGLASTVADLTTRLLASEERARTAKQHADHEGRPVDGAPAVTPVEARLTAELARTRKAYGALEETCRVLQAVNEVDARELRRLKEGAS